MFQEKEASSRLLKQSGIGRSFSESLTYKNVVSPSYCLNLVATLGKEVQSRYSRTDWVGEDHSFVSCVRPCRKLQKSY